MSGAAATVGARSTPRAEALWRYLGVVGDSDPREVLGIRGAVLTEGRIEAAAQRRWRQVAQHPAAGEPAAHFARSAIVQAAETLLGRVPGRGAWRGVVEDSESTGSSELDRRIASAIRSSGGLNHNASLRLARIAKAEGLAPVEILDRLRDLVERGGFRGRPRPSGGWRVARRLVRRGSGVPREIARLLEEVESVVDEAVQPDASRRRETAITVVSVSVLLALVFGVFLLRLVPEAADEPASPEAIVRGAETIDDPMRMPGPADGSEGSSPVVDVGDLAPVERFSLPESAPLVPPLWFEEERAAALRASADVPARLEDLARRIQGRNGVVDAALLEGWRSIQSIPARCWFDESPNRLRRVLGASREVVSAVETWTAAESLVAALGDLDPRDPSAERLRTAAWGAGLVGDLVRRPGLAAAVRDQLQRRLDVLGLPPRTGWTAPDAFEETAARWLAAAVESLAADAESLARTEAWSVWLAIVDAIEPIRLREALLVEGVLRLVRSWEDGDVSTMRPVRMAELLAALGPAVAVDPDGVRRVLEETARPGGRHAHPGAAWALSSLIARLPEFEGWAPIGREADGASRSRWLEEAIASWPLPSSPPSRVDPERLRRARELVALAAQRSRRDPIATISLLGTMGRLNEVLSDWEGSRARVRVVFEEVELDLLGTGDLGIDPPRSAPEPASLDGRFAGAMRQSLENRENRVDLVRELRRRSGGDLGPADAVALAKAAVKDAPEVRQAASALLIERFGSGPLAIEAFLGAIDGLETDPLVVRTVERLTGTPLPEAQGAEMAIAVRRALMGQLLAVLPSESRRMNLAMARYAATLARRRGVTSEVGLLDPIDEAAQFGSQRISRLEGRPATAGLLDRRDRRRGVAEGPSQRLAGELVTLVEAELAIARAERPDLAEEIDALGRDADRRRRRSESSLEQSLEMELVLAELAILLAAGGEA